MLNYTLQNYPVFVLMINVDQRNEKSSFSIAWIDGAFYAKLITFRICCKMSLNKSRILWCSKWHISAKIFSRYFVMASYNMEANIPTYYTHDGRAVLKMSIPQTLKFLTLFFSEWKTVFVLQFFFFSFELNYFISNPLLNQRISFTVKQWSLKLS